MKNIETIIIEELIAHNMNTRGIAPRLGVKSGKVYHIRRKLFDHARKTYPVKSEPTNIGVGYRAEPYHENEDDIGKMPTYEATNRGMITPIQKNWKLWQD